MKRFGLSLLYFTFFQLISVIISAQFYWKYSANNGGVSGSVFNQVHWLIWLILIIEFIISGVLIIRKEGVNFE